MTHVVVSRIVRESGGFRAPHVNEKVWLHNRRFKVIANLDKFTGVTMLHLENNQISHLGMGLRHMSKLKALYMHCNMLRVVDNLAANENLSHLNLATNQIASFEPGGLPASLNTVLAAANCLETAASIAPLAALPHLEVLDLSKNKLDGDDLFSLFPKFRSLRVLYLIGNPVQRAEYYRKRLVSGCPALTYLDTSPVEDLEKRGAEAWARGGRDAELQARKKFQDDKRAAQRATTRRIAAERAARRAAASLAPDGSGRKVLTPEMSAMLPSAVLSAEWVQALGEDECPVCQAALGSGERVLPLEGCGHVFHHACLMPWLTQMSATCPLCRAAVKPTPEGAGRVAVAGIAAETVAAAGAGGAAGMQDEPDGGGGGERGRAGAVLVGGRAAEVNGGRAAADLEVSRSQRILQVSQSLAANAAGGGGGDADDVAGSPGARVSTVHEAAAHSSSSAAAAESNPGRWNCAPRSNYVFSMPSRGAAHFPDGTLAGDEYPDGRSTGEGGQAVMTEDGGEVNGGGEGGEGGEGDGSEQKPTYTAGQQETNRVIQLQLRRRFSHLSINRAAVEADQFYSTAMFSKLKERRAMEAAAAAAAAARTPSSPGEESSVATKTTRDAAAVAAPPSSSSSSSSSPDCLSVEPPLCTSASPSAAKVAGQRGSVDGDGGRDGGGRNGSKPRDAALDEETMSVAERIAFAAKIAGVAAKNAL